MTEGVSAGVPARHPAPPPRPQRAQARIMLLLAAVAAAVVVAFGATTILGGPERKIETGIVVAVQATSLTSVEGFSIRTADGRTVAFRITSLENAATFPPGHLAEHKVSLVPIRVTYVEKAGANLAVRIEDVP